MFSYALIFTFGLLIGSFLNAVIYRLDSGEGIVRARSHCVTCGHVLTWYELVPIFSFIFQRGRCRACNARISLQYPLVELATAILFVFYMLSISSLLVVIFVYDLRHYIIPDKIVYPAIGIAFFYQLFRIFDFWPFGTSPAGREFVSDLQGASPVLLSALIAAAFFAAIFFISKGKWIGFGDVKLAFLMGLLLGWPGILVALFAAFMLGGIIGLGLIGTGKKSMKSQVPFGPYLVAGTFTALFWGEEIARWYLGLFV